MNLVISFISERLESIYSRTFLKEPFIFFLLFLTTGTLWSNNLDSLLAELDLSIENNHLYIREKEDKINKIKKVIVETDPHSLHRYNLNALLHKEYSKYSCDSAISYLNKNRLISGHLNDHQRELENVLQLSYLMGSTGMWKEAVDLLETINREGLEDKLLADYYNACGHVYGELSFYTQDKQSAERYLNLSDCYRDSLYAALPLDHELRLIMDETAFRNAGQYEEARKINNIRLSKVQFKDPDYAMVTYHRALSYKEEGDVENEKYYLALSALSDIQTATKDHASLWMLAQLLFGEGDVKRAYDYIRFSWGETVFYNAPLRSLQSAGILSLIDKTYQATIHKQKQTLQVYVVLISALFILLVIALVYIYKQMKKLSVAQSELQVSNSQLKELNEELQQINDQLQSTNTDLFESNQIKDEYIGRFMKLCSSYINRLDTYRRMVSKKISSGQTSELLSLTRSQSAIDNEVKELYDNFDTAFLYLFPDFIKKINQLLQADDPIIPKKGELLNTELRIFALIRLGINDSSQIAEFLRYSVNTIYNYRAKVKNKAIVPRDDFEDYVMKIR
ncbi:MAG: DUF6377 domain-containing protein [Bacteroidales bacterium]|jgi:cell division protein FtsB|nr:DUF6377 domain-containing protein [Bacteroidales bacterium]